MVCQTLAALGCSSSCASLQVKPKDVAAVCAKRPDIAFLDASNIEETCNRQYQQWLSAQKGRRDLATDSGFGADGEGEGNVLANMYKKVVKAVGITEE